MKMTETSLVRQRLAAIGFLALAGVLAGWPGMRTTVFAQHRMHGQQEKVDRNHPWMNASLSPDQRAEMVLKEMTLDEKIGLVHGMGMPGWPRDVQEPEPELGNGGAGFVLGVPRLGIPIIQISDAAYGVRSSGENGRYSTALPAAVGAAASWDTQAACAYGTLIGKELRAQGYSMTLGGGVNITREPRNGRTFEYLGEDPILAGTLVGNLMKCEQAQYVIGDIKHYAVNDQESGRNEVDAIISKRALRESDLLAFEIGVGGAARNARWRDMRLSELVTVPSFSAQAAAGSTIWPNAVVSVGQPSETIDERTFRQRLAHAVRRAACCRPDWSRRSRSP